MSKTYVIGDIHGCYDEFIALSQQIGITEDDLIIALGDIVDRGAQSVALFDYFKNRENAVVLMGNHERKHLNGVLSYAQEIVKVQFQDRYGEFLAWLKTLPYFYETDTAIIVHAFFEHDKKLYEQKEAVLAGTTAGSRYLEGKYEAGKYWSDYYRGEKPIIYGHHVVGEEPKIKHNTYGIDTGACHGGRLTAIELPSFTIHQLKVDQDYWKAEQAKWQIPVLEAKDWENMKMAQIRRQIQKLGYKKEPEVIAFLQHQKIWLAALETLMERLKNELASVASSLQNSLGDQFNHEVAKLPFRAFLFKAKANTLSIDDLQKTLDTPQKILDLAQALQLEDLPTRKS